MSDRERKDRREQSERRERSESPEEISIPIKPIPASKLQAFSVGSNKKTPFQKRKEEAELKKKQESVEAAKVYAEFVASFEETKDYNLGIKTFVRSNALLQGDKLIPSEAPTAKVDTTLNTKTTFGQEPKRVVEQESSRAPAFKPTAIPVSKPVQSLKSKPVYKAMPFVKAGEGLKPKVRVSMIMQEDEEDEEDMLALKEIKAQKKRNLDTFLEEIKKGQEDRQDKLRSRFSRPMSSVSKGTDRSAVQEDYESNTGSFDTGDSMTTNLYIGNINPSVDELMICKGFGKYGPIASVKIMWPRTTEEKERNRNCGFVSFMNRKDAEEALENMDGKDFYDYAMNVGWGKAVPLPAKPIFVLNESKRPLATGLPFNAQVANAQGGGNLQPRAEVKVVKPTNMQIVKIIHRVVERVLEHGYPMEAAIMKNEVDNTKFQFLFDFNSEEHIYYRWKLYSMLQGDTKSQWRSEAFQMYKEGVWWIPPDVPFDDEDMSGMMLNSDDEERENIGENIPKGVLGKIARQRLEIMLRQVTFQRGTIARPMAFAIDHADAADEVVEVVCKSLVIPETPTSTKLARLFLVSDILHNSSVHVPNAWKYRQRFESRLPAVFEHLNQVYRSMSARLKAEQVRRNICSVLSIWENWMVFPQHYIQALNALFMKKTSTGTEMIESSSEMAMTEEDVSLPEIAHETRTGSDAVEDTKEGGSISDVDGEPIDDYNTGAMDDVDGEPMDDIDGEPMDDVDGEPMDDVDGEPMDDVDGEPMNDMEGSFEDIDNPQGTSGSIPLNDVSDMFA
ncbi:hypothetical protein BDF14DRAFT_1825991 [Spinellus fusiger]|nr:hypothetical protein BDF14DRAFT_1825991 [Spinellus fusiger]